jgi:hypothetical protein
MRRRGFLKGALGIAALAAAPMLIRRAFADGSCPTPNNSGKGTADNLGALTDALKRAQRNGKHLLVFIIPAEDGIKYDRGSAFGAWLNHGTPKQIAPLARCEVVCATMADVKRLVPSVQGKEPLMVAIWPSGDQMLPIVLDAELPLAPRGKNFGDWKEVEKRDNEMVEKRIAVLAGLIRNLWKDPFNIDANADALAKEVKVKYVEQRVPGSRWGHASGCGTTVEGEEDEMRVACGMGHVPAKASRFLYMYAKTPGEQHREYMKQVNKSL